MLLRVSGASLSSSLFWADWMLSATAGSELALMIYPLSVSHLCSPEEALLARKDHDTLPAVCNVASGDVSLSMARWAQEDLPSSTMSEDPREDRPWQIEIA